MDQGEIVTLLLAAMSDESMKARLGELQAEHQRHLETLDELRRQHDANHQKLVEATAKFKAAEECAIANADRGRELDAREATMRGVLDGMNREKAAFDEIRRKIEADHAARENDLRARDTTLALREKAAAERAQQLDQREQDVIAAEAAHAKKADALRSALALP
jgi:rubrerythrin